MMHHHGFTYVYCLQTDKDKMLLLDFGIQTQTQLLYEKTCWEGGNLDRTVMLDCCIRSKLDMQFSASIKEVLCWKCILPLAHPQHLNQALKSWNIANRSQIHRATMYSISLHPGCANAISGKASGTIPKKERLKRVMSSIWKFSMQNTHPLDNFSIMRVKGEIFFPAANNQLPPPMFSFYSRWLCLLQLASIYKNRMSIDFP